MRTGTQERERLSLWYGPTMEHVPAGQVPYSPGPPLDGSLIEAALLMPLDTVIEVVGMYGKKLAAGRQFFRRVAMGQGEA